MSGRGAPAGPWGFLTTYTESTAPTSESMLPSDTVLIRGNRPGVHGCRSVFGDSDGYNECDDQMSDS